MPAQQREGLPRIGFGECAGTIVPAALTTVCGNLALLQRGSLLSLTLDFGYRGRGGLQLIKRILTFCHFASSFLVFTGAA